MSKFNATSLEARDIKIKITKIDIPVSFASAFEGEIIRKGDMQVEVDGSRVDCFELVSTKEAAEIEDHKITVDGPELDEIPVGSKISLSYTVRGRRQEHADRLRVRHGAQDPLLPQLRGRRHAHRPARYDPYPRFPRPTLRPASAFKHIGEVLYAKIKSEFEAVVDKCQVKIVVDDAKNKELRRHGQRGVRPTVTTV